MDRPYRIDTRARFEVEMYYHPAENLCVELNVFNDFSDHRIDKDGKYQCQISAYLHKFNKETRTTQHIVISKDMFKTDGNETPLDIICNWFGSDSFYNNIIESAVEEAEAAGMKIGEYKDDDNIWSRSECQFFNDTIGKDNNLRRVIFSDDGGYYAYAMESNGEVGGVCIERYKQNHPIESWTVRRIATETRNLLYEYEETYGGRK